MTVYRRYVALGDSISIDVYPGYDHMDRTGGSTAIAGLGAVSLFHKNDDALWPAFAGRDLSSRLPGIELQDETSDGATTGTVGRLQLPRVAPTAEPMLMTLTVGGNDLLGLVGADDQAGAEGLGALVARLGAMVEELMRRCPAAVLLLGTVYDPTDGSGRLEHVQLRPQELDWLARYNQAVRALCRGPVRLADIHRHFLGHGLSAPAEERWYWSTSSIEPGFRGASEVRRLWLDAAGLE